MRSRAISSKLSLARVLLLAALPLACAVGVAPEVEDNDASGDGGGTTPGGSLNIGGSAPAATAGKSSAGGSMSGAFGGTASTAGKPSTGGASGSSSAGGKGGSVASGGAAGTSSGGSASGGAAGNGAGCACPTSVTWMDNSVVDLKPGDCVDVAGAKYLYAGSKPQTWANEQCNPTRQEAWCPDMSNDYKFTACP